MTKRQEIEMQRRAYAQALVDLWGRCSVTGLADLRAVERKAAEAFPFPKVVRPRVVQGPDNRCYRLVDGVIERSYDGEDWRPSVYNTYSTEPRELFNENTRAELRAVLDLLDNPTEEIDAE